MGVYTPLFYLLEKLRCSTSTYNTLPKDNEQFLHCKNISFVSAGWKDLLIFPLILVG